MLLIWIDRSDTEQATDWSINKWFHIERWRIHYCLTLWGKSVRTPFVLVEIITWRQMLRRVHLYRMFGDNVPPDIKYKKRIKI